MNILESLSRRLKFTLIILFPELVLSQGKGGIGYDVMGGDNNWWLLPSIWLLFLFLVGVFALKNFLSRKIELYKLNRKIKYEEKIEQKTKRSEWLKSNEGKDYKKRKIKFWTRFYVFIGVLIGVFIYFSFNENNDRWVCDSKTTTQDPLWDAAGVDFVHLSRVYLLFDIHKGIMMQATYRSGLDYVSLEDYAKLDTIFFDINNEYEIIYEVEGLHTIHNFMPLTIEKIYEDEKLVRFNFLNSNGGKDEMKIIKQEENSTYGKFDDGMMVLNCITMKY